MTSSSPGVAVVGAGIGGLTLALALHEVGIGCQVHEAAPALAPLGVGINLLPHAVAVLDRLGLQDRLAAVAVTTAEALFANRFGQFIHREPAGLAAGYPHPQFSIHRGDLQQLLLDAVTERLGPEAVRLGDRCVGFDQHADGVSLRFDGADGPATAEAGVVVGCDGIHSAIRRQLYPDEGAPRYSGVTMWRGVTPWEQFLTGASMVRAGWLRTGKMVIYPIRDLPDGRQLVNWVAEIETPQRSDREWTRRGDLADFLPAFQDWHFDWLDVPALIRGAETVLEYPMVDQDPLPQWTHHRVTLLGDAAHPMVPRGSNGAGQAILDASRLAGALRETGDPREALLAYEADRLPATAAVVQLNRTAPPDILLQVVAERTGDRPFDDIDAVLPPAEIQQLLGRYNDVAGLRKG